MEHGRPDARRQPALRESGAGSADEGPVGEGSETGESVSTESVTDDPADSGSIRTRSRNVPEVPDDPDRVRRRIRDRAERIERREVAEALSSLEARGGLTDEQRETVRLLGAAITRKLTAASESAVERSERHESTGEREGSEPEREGSEPERDESATVRAVARLFDVETE